MVTFSTGIPMRTLVALMAALAMMMTGGLARDANAGATVDLLFVGHNGRAIGPTIQLELFSGDRFTMAVRMRNDQPLTAAIFSLSYDLEGDEKLDVLSAFQWFGVPINAK